MLIKMLTQAETLERYRESVKRRNAVFGAMSVLGLLMMSSGTMAFMEHWIASDRHSGFICGAGAGLALGGVLLLIQNAKLLKNEKKLKEEWIKEIDERNHLVALKTVTAAAGWTFALVYLALIISFFVNLTVFYVLAAAILGAVLILAGCRIYYERKI